MNARTSPVELTNICVIYDGDRILVENKIGHGICFPGGHVEPGESMEAAVIREMQEETGLTIASPRLRGIKDWMSADGSRFLVALYCTTDFTGTLEILRGRPGLLGHKGGICGNGCYLEHEGCPAHLRR